MSDVVQGRPPLAQHIAGPAGLHLTDTAVSQRGYVAPRRTRG